MKCVLFLLILHCFYQSIQCSCPLFHTPSHINHFEFGVNVGRTTFNVAGRVSLSEKRLNVPIAIQPCQKLVYVSVETRNVIGPPYVSVDWDVNVVVIKYRPLQYSISCYTIIAKTLPIPHCV